MPVPLAHALPQSIGAVPLTLVLTGLLAGFLLVNAVGTRWAAAWVGAAPPPPQATTVDPTGRDAGALGRAVGVTLAVATVLLSAAGPTDPANNLTDDVVLTLGWGLIALASMAVGPLWTRVNPVNAVSGVLAALAGEGPDHSSLPRATGTAVVVVLLTGWATLQLLVDPRPTGFAILVVTYVVGHALVAGARGRSWLALEPTNVLATTLGLLRPTAGGPLARLSRLPADARLGWVSATLIAWSLLDLVLETEWWHELGLRSAAVLPVGVAALAGTVVLLGVLITAASRRMGLSPAFVAVAGGWVVAHYLSILLIEGQGVPIWLSDPFGTGADLLGRRGDVVDFEPLPIAVLTALQIVPFLAGHVLAVAVVQRRAAARLRDPAQIGPATLEARAIIAALLLGGAWLQLAGV